MNSLRNLKTLTILLLLGASLWSCKPKKLIGPVDADLLKEPSLALELIKNSELDYLWFSTRFSGNVVLDQKSQNISGQLRIKKDSAIFVSIAPVLGIEVARAIITPDSVKMINRLESNYYLGNISYLNQLLNTDIDFYMLQAILTGNDFSHFQRSGFQVAEDRGRLRLSHASRKRISGSGSSFNNLLLMDPETGKLRSSHWTEIPGKRTLKMDYKRYEKISNQWVPAELEIVFSEAASSVNMVLSYSRTTLNQPQSMQFSIPARYTPLDLGF